MSPCRARTRGEKSSWLGGGGTCVRGKSKDEIRKRALPASSTLNPELSSLRRGGAAW